MHPSPSIRLTFGTSRFSPPAPMVTVALTPAELHRLSASLFRDAEAAERESRYEAAKSIAWRAAALREAAR